MNVFLKKYARLIQRLRRQHSLKKTRPLISKEKITSDLRSIGVIPDSTLLVHSSLKSIGYVDGGPDTVVDSLLEALGPGGTLLMPAFPMSGTMYRYLLNDPVFDPINTPSREGIITETFRLRKGVLRSLHPTHSVAAYGPLAEFLLEGQEKSNTPCGPLSPFSKLVDIGGYILCLGCGISKITSYPVVEDRVENFPLPVYLPDEMTARYLDFNGEEHSLSLKVHSPEISQYRIDKNYQKEAEIRELLLNKGIAKEGLIGEAVSYIVDAKRLEDFLEDGVGRGLTIYIDVTDRKK